VDNLCRKLLAYGLGRSLMLSDDATIDHMKQVLAANNNRFSVLIEAVVTSPQFTNRRSRNPRNRSAPPRRRASGEAYPRDRKGE